MKTLIVHKDENIGGVELKQGAYSGAQLVDADVHLRDIANLVARGRAEWRHGSVEEKPAVTAEVVPVAKAVRPKKRAQADE